MGLLKSNLRISAGLLKEAAPDNHLLAYITPNERNMLVQAGGSGHITKSGIPSFEESWDSSVDSGGWDMDDTGGADDNSSPPSGNGGDAGDPDQYNTTPPAQDFPDYESGSPENTRTGMSDEMANRTRELTLAQHEAVLGDHGDPMGSPDEQAKYARYVKYTAENQPLNKTEDLTFKEHWDNAPGILKYSLVLRGLYAAGKNLAEWARSKGWNWNSTTGKVTDNDGNEVSESDMQGATASQAPYMVSGTTPVNSTATQWYANLGQGTQGFNFHSAYANAKAAVSQRLGNSTSVGQLAVNQSPFYNWLKDNSLNKGIL
jgi:hypothetical protein